jgi:hypothetical protein
MLLLLNSTKSVPAILGFSPPTGAVGRVVEVVGTGFIGVTAATIGSTSQVVAVISDSTCQVTVQAGTTTGKIALTNSAGTGTSAVDFVVTPPPLDISGVSDGQLLRRVSGAVSGLNIGAGLAEASGALVITLLGVFNTWAKNQRVTPSPATTSATNVSIDVQESQLFTLALEDSTVNLTFSNAAPLMSWYLTASSSAVRSLVFATAIRWLNGNIPPNAFSVNEERLYTFVCTASGVIVGSWGVVP